MKGCVLFQLNSPMEALPLSREDQLLRHLLPSGQLINPIGSNTCSTPPPPPGWSLPIPPRGSAAPLPSSSGRKCRVRTLGLRAMDGAYAKELNCLLGFQ